MLIVPALAQAAFLGFDVSFQQAYKAQQTYWEQIASLKPSSTSEERHLWSAEIGDLREWNGERVFQNVQGRVQVLRNKKFEKSFEVPRDVMEDDQYGMYSGKAESLARAAKRWPDKLVTDALIAGSSTATSFDGQYFFDTDHPQDVDDPSSAVQSNLFTARPMTPDNVAYIRSQMMSLVDDHGVPLEIRPNLLVVPPQLEYPARQIMNSQIIGLPVNSTGTTVGTSPGGAAGADNVLRGTMDVLVLPRLAAHPTEYYLMDTTRGVKPLIFQQRTAPEFAWRNRPEDDNTFERDVYQYGVRARGAAGYGLWFLAAKGVTT